MQLCGSEHVCMCVCVSMSISDVSKTAMKGLKVCDLCLFERVCMRMRVTSCMRACISA